MLAKMLPLWTSKQRWSTMPGLCLTTSTLALAQLEAPHPSFKMLPATTVALTPPNSQLNLNFNSSKSAEPQQRRKLTTKEVLTTTARKLEAGTLWMMNR